MAKKKPLWQDVAIAVAGEPAHALKKSRSPRVATDKCLNCGTCVTNCPTHAIREMQRQICRLCPDCAEGPIMFPRDMESLTQRSCGASCPLGHSPEGYLNLAARNDPEGAWNLIASVNPLPGVLGRICSRPCEEACKRGILIDKPMYIRGMKRAIADWAYENGKSERRSYPRCIDKRIAVVGGGPAGLTAACDLAQMGYRVSIFEKTGGMGGMIRRAIPAFRLPDEVWRREFEWAIGDDIDVKFGVSVGISPTIEELFDDGYRAVILAMGAPNGKKLPIPGHTFKGVCDALQYMSDVKYGIPAETGEDTVVVGGGSVATDVARTALRKGARNVTMVCIEDEAHMPALSWEIEEAISEGVKVIPAYAPLSVNSKWMRAESVTLAAVTRIETTETGELRPVIDRAATREIPAQTVIFAVGQATDRALLDRMGLARNAKGGIVTDECTLATSLRGVYAAGDLAGGANSVVEAMASARKAAKAVDAFLMNGAPDDALPAMGSAPLREKIFPVRLEKLTPLKLKEIKREEALASFDEVLIGASLREFETDARRCMKCGYIEVDHALCVGCGTCKRVCPAGDVITMCAPLSGGEEE
ncbi:MAG: FAD-dependent oxidoreductase [Clostridiales Family XIII bacterium]|nr:FAD-dependent oxidoreductase [Clostridiales Family XIII bacterium]